VSLAADTSDDGEASPSESECWLPSVAPVDDVARADSSLGGGVGGGRYACVGPPPTAPMDTVALRGEEPMPFGATETGRSRADGAGKRVAGHPEGEADRGREDEESRCTAVSGNGGSSALIMASREMYMLISEPTPPSVGEVVGEHSVTSRIGTIGNVGGPEIGLVSREFRDHLPRGGGDSPVKSLPCCEGKSIFK
jgi:hypothetical protein